MLNTTIAAVVSLAIVFGILKLMEYLENFFPKLEEKWVEKVTIIILPILWIGLGYAVYGLIS